MKSSKRKVNIRLNLEKDVTHSLRTEVVHIDIIYINTLSKWPGEMCTGGSPGR